MKLILVTGGVISGIGKGVTIASIAQLLIKSGLKVDIRKLDPYLNMDPGTINPIEHGEVYVTNDGTETDLDLGHYERFTGLEMKYTNSTSFGKLIRQISKNEREGKYLGQTIQMVPHVTDSIKEFITANSDDFDIILCEIGGSVGDIEASAFLEAIRQLHTNYPGDVMTIHVTYIVYSKACGELKTKPTQNSIKSLMMYGIIPKILICRTEHKLTKEIKQKLINRTSIPVIIEALDVKDIYDIPNLLLQQDILKSISKNLDVSITRDNDNNDSNDNNDNSDRSDDNDDNDDNDMQIVNIGIIGKYVKLADSYKSLIEAINAASKHLNIKPSIHFIDAKLEVEVERELEKLDCMIVPGGFGTSGVIGKLEAIKYARVHKIPFLGICFGMQLSIIEFARNVLNINAGSEEFLDKSSLCIIKKLPEQSDKKLSGTMRLGSHPILFNNGSLLEKIYSSKSSNERHRHRYYLNDEYKSEFAYNGMIFSGKDSSDSIIETIEYNSKEQFFIGCQYHPEFNSRNGKPNPIFVSLLKECNKIKEREKWIQSQQLLK